MSFKELSPTTRALFLALSDGERHPISEIRALVAEQCSPERVERELLRLRRQSPNPAHYTYDMALSTLVTRILSYKIHDGWIERENDQIRLLPRGNIQVLKAQGFNVRSPLLTRQAPHTQKLFDILDDGAWHNREEVLRQIAVLVPPEKGYRVTMKQRASAGKRRGHNNDERRGDPHRTGQRFIANSTMARMITKGSILAEGDKIRAQLPGTGGARIVD